MAFRMLFSFLVIFLNSLPLASPEPAGLANGTVPATEISDGVVLSKINTDTNMSTVAFPDGIEFNAGSTKDETPGVIEVTMGTERVHVGCIGSQNRAQDLRGILDRLCDHTHVPGRACKGDAMKIDKIRYNHKGKYGGLDSSLIVKVESDYIPTTPGSWDPEILLTLFKDQIVTAFDAAIHNQKNWYHIETKQPLIWAPTKCWEFANSGNFYQVAIRGLPDGFSSAIPHMRVSLEWSRPTTEGKFDCKGTLSNVWGSGSLDGTRIGQYAKAVQYPLRGAVTCADQYGEGKPSGDCPKGITQGPGCFTGRDDCLH